MTVELTPTAPCRYTVEEYLAIEEKSEIRHEFVNGKLIAMAGSSSEHDQICVTLTAMLSTALKGTPCRIFSSNMRVQTDSRGRYRYPDLTVACMPTFNDDRKTTLLNPAIIVEVTSESTRSIDTEDKLREYTSIDSMRQYILLSQHDRRAIVYTRFDTSSPWTLSFVDGQGKLELPALGFSLPMDDIYAGVVFEEKEKPQ
jgi:Uma2 family endonuclease